MLTRKSSKVRVVKPQKCPCNCAFPHDATKQASTRTLIESKQKENSPNLQKTDKMKKKSTKTGKTKPSETLQNTKQVETSTRLSRNKARTQNTKTLKNTSKSNENRVRKAQFNNNSIISQSSVFKNCNVLLHQLPEEITKSKTLLQDAKQAETSPKLSRNKAKPSKTLQNTKQVETRTKLSRNKAPTHSKSNENLVRKSQFNNNSMQSQSVVKKCYVLLHQLPEDVIKTKLAQEATGKGKQRLQKCDTLSKGVTHSQNEANIENLPIPLQHKVQAIDAISQKKPKKSIPSSKLRKRKTMNYAESSLEMSMSGVKPSEKPQENRVPIYKLNINNETEPKPHEDTYEFDSSDCEKGSKKKRRKVDDSSSDEYNKTIQGILRNIANRVRKRKNGILPKKRQNKVIKARAEPSKQKTAPQPILDKDCNKNILQKNVKSDDDDDGVDNSDFTHCFGFKEKIPKVKILSDIHLKPNNEINLTLATPTKFRESRPNANSTMIGGNVLTPWRFNDINIKRNPHFITLKESSLPCISQEMVLDHSIVDKFGDHSKLDATNRGIGQDIRRTPVQKRVTDYFVCDSMKKTNGEDKENLQVSLFDSDMFSPIKSTNQFTRVESVKRKILGEKTDDNVQVSTPITQNVSVVQSPILEEPDGLEKIEASNKENDSQVSNSNRNGSDKDNTYFGFDSENDDQVTPQKNKNEKPFRLSVNVSDRKYTRKPKQTRKLLKKVEPVVSSDDESDTSVPEEHNGEYRLFDDFDDTFDGDTIQEPGIIKKKRTRRRLNDDGQNAYHQRRKDMRTKEEEEEAEKWAKAFNSLCEEIEEFPLEIE